MLSVILMLIAGHTFAKTVTISNVLPRYNTSGEIMDAHDGSYNQWGGPGTPFYYYAMGYGTCKQGGPTCHGCGYGYSWIGVWKSPDLSNNSWTLLREARDSSWPRGPDVGAYFRVHVIYNALTKLYVMWINLSNCNPGCYVTGTSPTPEGPFTFKRAFGGRFPRAGDFDLFIDDDQQGYLIYTSTSQGHRMSVERLSDDFLTSVYASPPPSPPAPISGFTLVGSGACRDSNGKEPPFFTNERSKSRSKDRRNFLNPTFDRLTEDQCASACRADHSCTAFSWCDGEGPGAPCNGACHLYVTATTPPPPPPPPSTHAAWSYSDGQHGDPTKVTRVTSENWWRCERKAEGVGMANAANVANWTADVIFSATTQDEDGLADTGPTANSSGYFGNVFVEAPVMFKRDGVYYALFDQCCCFCESGSGAGVYTSTVSPLGPWTYHDNIACQTSTGSPFQPPSGQGCPSGHSVTRAQQNFILPIREEGQTTPTLIWTGDMWQSAADGVKAHDHQFWAPLQWSPPAPGSNISLPKQLVWVDNFTITL